MTVPAGVMHPLKGAVPPGQRQNYRQRPSWGGKRSVDRRGFAGGMGSTCRFPRQGTPSDLIKGSDRVNFFPSAERRVRRKPLGDKGLITGPDFDHLHRRTRLGRWAGAGALSQKAMHVTGNARRIRPRLRAPDRSSRGPATACVGGGARGFSLPELLVVLLVVGLLSLLVIPNIEIVRYRMDGAARGAVAALVAAQRQAVVRQHDVIVAFDAANRRLRIHQDRDNDGSIGSTEPTRIVPFDDGVQFGRGGTPALFGTASVTFTETQDGMPVVRFIRTGSTSEEGGFYLTSDRALQDSGRYPQDARAVEVERATGRVTWYYYDPDQWKKGF